MTGAFGMAIVSFVVVAIVQFTDDQILTVRLPMVLLVLLSLGCLGRGGADETKKCFGAGQSGCHGR